MKKILCIIMILFASTAIASPYLVCDPQAGVETYLISEAGQPDMAAAAQTDGSIKYDLASVADGTHTWSVKACNIWGCSGPSPFSFTKSLPAPAGSLKIVKD